MSTYRDLARTHPHLRVLLEHLACRYCANVLHNDVRQLCAYDFASDSWFCSEEHLRAWTEGQKRGVISSAAQP